MPSLYIVYYRFFPDEIRIHRDSGQALKPENSSIKSHQQLMPQSDSTKRSFWDPLDGFGSCQWGVEGSGWFAYEWSFYRAKVLVILDDFG